MSFSDDEFERKHPSYGMLQISRVTGGSGSLNLYGSPLAHHYGTIRISIGEGIWYHNGHHDRFYGPLRGQHIEIEMSQAQFADAITSLNMGGGTPCTIRYIAGKQIEDPPDFPTEAEYIRENFEAKIDTMADKAKDYAAKIMKLVEKLPEKKRREIEIALDVIQHQLTSNIPFVVKQFQEATTRITTAAKAEVDGFTTSVFRAAGIQAIAEGRLPSLLPASDTRCKSMRRPGLVDQREGRCVLLAGHEGEHSLAPEDHASEPKHTVIKAGTCPACLEAGDCMSQCPNAGLPRCEIDHLQNCQALLCGADDECDCGHKDQP